MFCILVVVVVAGVYKFVRLHLNCIESNPHLSQFFKKHVLERHNAKEMDWLFKLRF